MLRPSLPRKGTSNGSCGDAWHAKPCNGPSLEYITGTFKGGEKPPHCVARATPPSYEAHFQAPASTGRLETEALPEVLWRSETHPHLRVPSNATQGHTLLIRSFF